MEVSFRKEIESLRLGNGATFHGEGILAVTKALLQSGVAYVGGYQGAPVSHLLDVLVQSEDLLSELGIHLETCTNEAAAAAMLGASINYPLRGAVSWKSIVGTNVAADALSNLASPGVQGGALIVDLVEQSFPLSEASHTPVMMMLRVRACHVQGRFVAKDNVPPAISTRRRLAEPAPFDYARLAHPPLRFLH